MFKINSLQLQEYFKLLIEYAKFGYFPIAAMVILNDNTYSISYNTKNEHAEYILTQYYKYENIKAILITLEPCISCAFHIIDCNIPYVFFSNYNQHYGGFKYITYKHKCKVFGGLYINNLVNDFFLLKR